MKNIIPAFLALFLCPFIAQAQEVAFSIQEGPYLQNVQENEFTVVWKSSANAIAWVEIAPEDGLHFNGAERRRFYATHIGQRQAGMLHSVRVTGLEPATSYRYRILQQAVSYDDSGRKATLGQAIGSTVYQREPYRVRTVDPDKGSVAFMVLNDIHNRDSLFRVFTKDVKKEAYDFVVFNGDMTSFMRSEEEIFDGYLRSASQLFATDVPFYMVRGNHETRGELAGRYMDYFPSPTGLPYYTYSRGSIFFVVLDGGEDKPDSNIEYYGLADYGDYRTKQAEWLAGVVESPGFREASHRIVFVHMPPVRSNWYGPGQVASVFGPLLSGKDISLMMCGHTHKEYYVPAGEEGFDFPILINSNQNCLKVDITPANIKLRVVGPKGVDLKVIDL